MKKLLVIVSIIGACAAIIVGCFLASPQKAVAAGACKDGGNPEFITFKDGTTKYGCKADLTDDQKAQVDDNAAICGTPDFLRLPFCNKNNPNAIPDLINYAIIFLLSIAGAIILLMVIVSGIQMSTSAGNPEALKKARGRLINAIISLVLLIAMSAIFALIGLNLK